jgi:hypothetical protein
MSEDVYARICRHLTQLKWLAAINVVLLALVLALLP